MIIMECEICGKPISDNPIRAKIEGSVMAVCSDCAKLGRIQKEPPKPKFQSKKKTKNSQPKKQYNSRRDEPTEELIEDYADTIRRKREANNWSREQLAEKVFEKTSVITRIETGKMVPDLKLTKKIEKTLNLKLLEKMDDLDLDQFKGLSSSGFTLGDVVKIKRK